MAIDQVIFGTAQLGRVSGSKLRQEILETAYSCGIKHFDTARLYGFGEVEKELSSFLKNKRDEIILTNKFGYVVPKPNFFKSILVATGRRVLKVAPFFRKSMPGLKALGFNKDFSAEFCLQSLHESLKLTNAGFFDYYLAHDYSNAGSFDHKLQETLSKLCKEGKVREYGVSGQFSDLSRMEFAKSGVRIAQFENNVTLSNHGFPNLLNFTYNSFGEEISKPYRLDPEFNSEDGKTALYALLAKYSVLFCNTQKVIFNSTKPSRIKKFCECFVSITSEHPFYKRLAQ